MDTTTETFCSSWPSTSSSPPPRLPTLLLRHGLCPHRHLTWTSHRHLAKVSLIFELRLLHLRFACYPCAGGRFYAVRVIKTAMISPTNIVWSATSRRTATHLTTTRCNPSYTGDSSSCECCMHVL
jgi:hypothetical protein